MQPRINDRQKMDGWKSQHTFNKVQIKSWMTSPITNSVASPFVKIKTSSACSHQICSVTGGQLKGSKHIRARGCTQHTTQFSSAFRALKSLNATYDTDLAVWPTELATCVDHGCVLLIHSHPTTVTGRCTMWFLKNQKNSAPVEISTVPRHTALWEMLIVATNESKSNLNSIKDEL